MSAKELLQERFKDVEEGVKKSSELEGNRYDLTENGLCFIEWVTENDFEVKAFEEFFSREGVNKETIDNDEWVREFTEEPGLTDLNRFSSEFIKDDNERESFLYFAKNHTH
ncbi:hypothetical protein [Pseudalkalibacillus caeni]|uniref:Uncharacterized protein n=1 Tax=Exobacillus caeni TaxID=2574798 RepID=A0A5R9F3Q2_9BACL|nr:hypothetical protein [Pseudalkalibacillus caeni]TLS37611.1 hypothetical protein FCL54_10760 [Pseudalkalibacillus caeni]